jgi:hypothetical protein
MVGVCWGGGEWLSRECLYLKCLPKPSFADMTCRVGDMSLVMSRLGDIACRLECLNETTRHLTTFDNMCQHLSGNGHLRQNSPRDHGVRAALASNMGCGGRTPSTQHIAMTLTPLATRQYTGSNASVHHSLSDFTILGVTFCMHNT